MHQVLFRIGAMLVIFALLMALALWSTNVLNMPARELITLVGLGGMLMLPELLYQLRQFFTSASSLDE